ncbi:MAG: methyltransferase domain-containing protein [Dehalococcoidia bacterium]|nr:methyltransferase domain-containing protein [Dehalococcoidia bacterium]
MKRILIWGGDSWANLGDSAILSATIAALKETIPEAELLVTSARPGETTEAHNVPSIKRTPARMLKALAECDLLVWGGGQLLQNASSKTFLLLQLCLLLTAKLMHKKVICYAQGVGPITDPVSRTLAGIVVGSLDAITVRDRYSYDQLKDLGINEAAIQVTADPAIALKPASAERAEAIMRYEGLTRPFVVLALRRWGHYKSNFLPVSVYAKAGRWPTGHSESFARFLSDIARLADQIASQLKAQVLFLPMSPGDDQGDEAIAETVLGMMTERESGLVLRGRYHPFELKALLGEAALVIGLRTHSVILACSAGTPAIAISYSGKGESFMTALGLPEYSLPFERAFFDRLWPMVKDAWMKREVLSAHLDSVIPELERKAVSNAIIARELLDGAPDKRKEKILARKFDREAREWDGYYNGTTPTGRPFISESLRARKKAVLSFADAQPGQTVLDLGCGPGEYAGDILSNGAFWYGVDLSQVMLKHAQARISGQPWGRLVQGSAAFVPLKSSSVDVVICSGVVDYLSQEQLAGTVKEIRRVLKPDGALCITTNLRDPFRWLRSRAPAWMPVPLRVVGPAYFHSEILIKVVEACDLPVMEVVELWSNPFGGTLVVKAAKRVSSKTYMEPAGASGQLL